MPHVGNGSWVNLTKVLQGVAHCPWTVLSSSWDKIKYKFENLKKKNTCIFFCFRHDSGHDWYTRQSVGRVCWNTWSEYPQNRGGVRLSHCGIYLHYFMHYLRFFSRLMIKSVVRMHLKVFFLLIIKGQVRMVVFIFLCIFIY